jgi:DNA-binding NarL/FixJ family response regulator
MVRTEKIEGAEEHSTGAAPIKVARIMIADDHTLVREGLRTMLSGEDGLEVIAEAQDGQEALSLCRELEPDLVLMDVRMPTMDGLEATKKIKQELPKTSVMMVTMHENPDYLFEAIKVGAAGYVLKDASGERLIGAVRRTLEGESPLNQELAMQLLVRLTKESEREDTTEGFGETGGERSKEADPGRSKIEPLHSLSSHPEASRPGAPHRTGEGRVRDEVGQGSILTPREVEVLRLLSQGQTNPQIAQNLLVSRGTVKIHVQHIISKLGVSDRTQAAVRAIEAGLLGAGTRR